MHMIINTVIVFSIKKKSHEATNTNYMHLSMEENAIDRNLSSTSGAVLLRSLFPKLPGLIVLAFSLLMNFFPYAHPPAIANFSLTTLKTKVLISYKFVLGNISFSEQRLSCIPDT